jgi:hypothetical protein
MPKKPPLSSRSVEKLSERERSAGLDPDDPAARWLAEHDPAPPPAVPKRALKNKSLHRWQNRRT